jgi:hypothetical protein
MLSATNAQYTMFKNRLINGNCAINQRVSSLATNNTSGYFVDRMWGFSGVSTAATFSQISSTGLDGFPNAARAQRNSGNTGTANYYTGQIIESRNLQDLQGQTVTLSFWARCGANFSAPSSLAVVQIATGTAADQGLASYLAQTWTGVVNQSTTVTLTTSWQKFTYTATLGSTIQEILVFIGTNGMAGTAGAADYIDVTGWQLEKGSSATSFDYRPYTTELQLCQRYYQQFGAPVNRFFTNTTGSSGNSVSTEYLRTDMRTSPSVSQITGTTATLTNVSTNTSTTQTITFDGLTTSSYRFYPASAMTTSVIYIISGLANIQCSAEL